MKQLWLFISYLLPEVGDAHGMARYWRGEFDYEGPDEGIRRPEYYSQRAAITPTERSPIEDAKDSAS